MLRQVDAETIHRVLAYGPLIERLRRAFHDGASVPPRHHHTIPIDRATPDGTLLLMPAWVPGRHIGIKTVTVFPGNVRAGLPSVIGTYTLLDGRTGAPLALLDGVALTLRRTAAASALASGFLSRLESEVLLMVGAGALAPHLIGAHCAVRPIRQVLLWNRSIARARALAADLSQRMRGPAFIVTDNLEGAVRQADVITCATLSPDPVIRGAWLRPGQHVDLVGGFTPKMREVDDLGIKIARIYVDTRPGALAEAGDLVDPIRRNIITEGHIQGDLFDLARGRVRGRQQPEEVTLFKSVGTALEDLVAAEMVVEQLPA